jgi:hypothetical protein
MNRNLVERKRGLRAPFLFDVVRQAWRVARKRKRGGRGGLFADLEVQVLCRP